MSVRRLGRPHRTQVRPGAGGSPAELSGECVDAVLEEWVVEDRWWTAVPVRRRYFELVLAGGRNAVVFRDLATGAWFEQRG